MKDDRVYLYHILDSIEYIKSDTSGGEDVFMGDRRIRDAVIRNLEIIGEAVKKISDDFKKKYPNIPWRQIAGMRDKLIHEYFGVNLTIVWDTVVEFLPVLERQLREILEELEDNK
jgi:uncharacterized protein with HEPN domain